MTLATTPTVRRLGQDAQLLVNATVAGAFLGFVDLALQLTIGYPWANVANSSAMWALSAFAFAFWAGTTPARAAVAGVMLLLVATEAYYATAVLTGHADLATLWSPNTVRWLQVGVVAGVVFGVAGTWARDERRPWRAAAGIAAASSVFLAEAGVRLLPESGSAPDDLGTVLLMTALAGGVLLSQLRHPGRVARAAVLVPPMAVAGTVAFALYGF